MAATPEPRQQFTQCDTVALASTALVPLNSFFAGFVIPAQLTIGHLASDGVTEEV